jgi:hypothetical protein
VPRSSILVLRGELFGDVASDSKLYRTLRRIDPITLGGLWGAMAEPRAKVWCRSAATTGKARVVLDLDGSLVEIHTTSKERRPTTSTASGSTR